MQMLTQPRGRAGAFIFQNIKEAVVRTASLDLILTSKEGHVGGGEEARIIGNLEEVMSP